MMLWVFARDVVEEHDVSIAADAYQQQFSRFEDAYEGLKWLLARRGDRMGLHRTVGNTGYRLYRQDGDPVAQTPSLIVVYTVNDQQVVLIGLTAQAFVGTIS
jgi:hypothetical protein